MIAGLRFIGLRVLRGLLTIWFAVTVTFFLLRLLPGDPVLAVADPTMTEALRQKLLADFGLDQPLSVQYVGYLGQLLQGNMGVSFRQSLPVTEVLMQRLPWTLILTGAAILVTVVLGVPLGVYAATRAKGFADRAIQIGGITAQSLFVPSVGILLLYVFGVVFGWFPIGGAVDPDATGFAATLSMLHHLVLPCLSLVFIQLGSYVLAMRSSLIEVLGEDYVALAKAKGVSPRAVVWKHALRNALLPTTTLVGLQLGTLVGGAVLTETIYAYPGIGRAVYESVGQLDFPVLQGAFVLLAVAVVVANLITDIVYGLLDPRVRTS
ncbi:ABC transporter permease [Allonocardiopsis opalescens]|uniref:Peptide/nickel transport system permease protein n=1 Tax=Allonocardiopsis opalescens TaxID=1144618 RepID=A0A2T0Q0G6_9ACTN|nr:ABC transporter permease [Allonocardiopsis opalescens]PRX97278.1 peptide/nickel transport system permease protein [Allonocardiopsis opalescens]